MRSLLICFLICGAAAAQSDETGFVPLFDGRSLDGWFIVNRMGPGFLVEDGVLVCPREGGQKLMTEKQYSNFVFRFEFRLEPDANNGIGIRAPRNAHTATQGMEIQILDDDGPAYSMANLRSDQYHGSIYDVLPARRGFLTRAGEWNRQEISAIGRRVTVRLNGETILDADLDSIRDPQVLAKHPGLGRTSGHIALLGHQSRIEFRNLRVKELP